MMNRYLIVFMPPPELSDHFIFASWSPINPPETIFK
jgi:hypothetical protein